MHACRIDAVQNVSRAVVESRECARDEDPVVGSWLLRNAARAHVEMTSGDPRPLACLPFADQWCVAIGDRVEDICVPHWFRNQFHSRWHWYRRATAEEIKDFVAQLAQSFDYQIVNPETGAGWIRARM